MAARENSKVVDKNEIKEKPTPLFEKEDLAPDGGWGWMIVAGMITVTLVTASQGSSVGLIYGDFLDASGNSGSALTVLNLMVMISFSASGLISNELLKRYNMKLVGIIGALIYAIANTVICFVPNVTYMAILYFAQGMGMGLMTTVCNTSFNAYFVKRRTKVMGVAQVMVGLGTIIYPSLIATMLSAYGFRGCAALLGAISFNAVAFMLVMDPVEQHCKKPIIIAEKVSINEDQEMDYESGSHNLGIGGKEVDPIRRHSMNVAKGWERNKSLRSLRAEAEHESPLLVGALKASHISQDRNGSALEIVDLLAISLPLSVAVSMVSINRIAGITQIAGVAVKDADEKKKSIRSVLEDFFEVSLLRDGVYVNICIGGSFTFMTDLLFMSLFPMTMSSQGYAKSDIALALTVSAVAELVGKLLYAVFAMFVKTKARHVYLVSVYCLVVCRIAFLYCDTLMSILIVHGISGIVRSLYLVNHMLILAEHVKIERFPAAWGLSAVINGCTAIVICPLVGFVKDLTQSYVIAQYMLLGVLMVCLISWTIEIFIYQIFTKKKTTETVNRK